MSPQNEPADVIERFDQLKRNIEAFEAANNATKHVYEALQEAARNPQSIPSDTGDEHLKELKDKFIKEAQELDAIFTAAETGDVKTLREAFKGMSESLIRRLGPEVLKAATENNQTEAADFLNVLLNRVLNKKTPDSADDTADNWHQRLAEFKAQHQLTGEMAEAIDHLGDADRQRRAGEKVLAEQVEHAAIDVKQRKLKGRTRRRTIEPGP